MTWLLSILLASVAASAQAAEPVWVQATASGYEARIATTAASCPPLTTDSGETAMVAIRAS